MLWYSDSNSPVQLGDVVRLFKDKHPSIVVYVPETNNDMRGLEVVTMDERKYFMSINPGWIGAYWK